jgi:hypothetical protein
MDETKGPSLKEETSTRAESHAPKSIRIANRTKAAPYWSRRRISKDQLLSRLGTFFLAILAALALLFTKRYDIDYLFGFGEERHWIDSAPVDTISPHSMPGHPYKEYAICTRTKGGIYTVDEEPEKNRTQCIVVGADGTIAGTGSIGAIELKFW